MEESPFDDSLKNMHAHVDVMDYAFSDTMFVHLTYAACENLVL